MIRMLGLFFLMMGMRLLGVAQVLPDYMSAGHTSGEEIALVNRGNVLFSSFPAIDPPAYAVISQNFTDDGIDFQTYGADDFTISDCGWTIDEITVRGNYSNNLNPMSAGPATSVNVFILPKEDTLPASTDPASIAVWFATGMPYTELDLANGGDFQISIPNITLAKGDYWLIVQANMAFLAGGQWNWTESSLTTNSGTTNGDESAWFQSMPFIVSPVTMMATCAAAWGRRVTDCSITRFPDSRPPADLDFAFQIAGYILTAGTTISETNLTTTEDGDDATYTLVLTSPPCLGETVTVTPSVGDATEGSHSPPSVIFTTANWNMPQTIIVTPGSSGDGNDGDVMYQISHAVTTDDPAGCYLGILAATIDVTNQNIDASQTISVQPNTGLMVSEDGALAAIFTIAASGSLPSTDVTVALTIDNPSEVMLSSSSVMLNAGNGFQAAVTVTGVSDDVKENNLPFTITTEPAVSGDVTYNGVNPANVSGINLDSNIASVIVMGMPSPLVTSETDNGISSSSAIAYRLSSQPTRPVTFVLDVDDASEVALSTTNLVFNDTNWNQNQIVPVFGLDDMIQDGNRPFNVISSNTSSSDVFYEGVPVSLVQGTNLDDTDLAGVIVAPTSGLVTQENGTTDMFTVHLNSEPMFPVSLDFVSNDVSEGLVHSGAGTPAASTTLTFDAANWMNNQTVTVTGQQDLLRLLGDGDVTYSVSGENMFTGDVFYSLITDAQIPNVEVTNQDDDPEAAILATPSILTFLEDDAPMMIAVRLTTQPDGGDVLIPISSLDTSEVTVSPNSLTFTQANWDTVQNVMVTPNRDYVIDGDQMTTIMLGAASGANYGGLSVDVSVTVEDVDSCDVMSLVLSLGAPILASGHPNCVFDLYKSFGSDDPADWMYLGTFILDGGGQVDTGVLPEPDCTYLTTIAGTYIILTVGRFSTVPALGLLGLFSTVVLLALAAVLVSIKRRKRTQGLG